MSASGNLTTTLIITKGLFTSDSAPPGFTALSFGSGVTPWFSVYIADVPIPPPSGGGGGGSRVYAPGEIAHLYKPIDPGTGLPIGYQAGQDPIYVSLDKEAEFFRKNKIVTFKINFAGRNLEKVYSVSERGARSIVEAANMINATKKQISMLASGIKRITSTAIIRVGRFTHRTNKDK